MQRGEALVVGLADISTAVNQLTDGGILAVETGQVKRRVSKGVAVVCLLQGNVKQKTDRRGESCRCFSAQLSTVTCLPGP